MSGPVVLFLEALFRALHSTCVAWAPHGGIVYGGNCWDAIQTAIGIGGGWARWLP